MAIDETSATKTQIPFWQNPGKMQWVERVVVVVGLVLATATVVCALFPIDPTP